MRLVKALGAAIVAVLAFSAMTVAGATAHEFESSQEPGLLSVKYDGLQTFITPAGTVNCTALSGHGIAKTKKAKTQVATVSYTACTATIGSTVTTPINAEYLFNAENEEVRILKEIKIVVNAPGVKCTVTVPVQNGLKSIKYDNLANNTILVLANVTNIESSAVGSVCAAQYTSNKTGKYTGNTIVEEVAGGQIKWI